MRSGTARRTCRAAALLLVTALLAPRLAGAAVEISAAELARMLVDRPDLLLLDGRGREAYRNRSLRGALDVGGDPAAFLPDGRGGPVVLLLRPDSSGDLQRRWVERLESARHRVYLLLEDEAAWLAAGLMVVTPAESYVRPGSVPFLIPRGLCEANEPVRQFR